MLYYSQSKSWMTRDILSDVLVKINRKLKKKGRSVLLFMDNAGCHPADLKDKFSNIKIAFLPANMTSKLQPLDLGIIMNFKVHYRQFLMHYVLAKIEECSSATEVTKSLTILNAIRWVAESWSRVTPDTIQKCFRKAGFLDKNMKVTQPASYASDDHFADLDSDDPFADVDLDSDVIESDSGTDELRELVSCLELDDGCCSVEEFLVADESLQVYMDTDDSWEENFLAEIGPSMASKSPRSQLISILMKMRRNMMLYSLN